MTQYDEDDEPVEATPEEAAPRKVLSATIELDEAVVAHMIARKSEELTERSRKSLEATFKERFEATVDTLVAKATSDLIQDECRRLLAEGWTLTNQWGEKQKTVTLRDRITTILEEKNDQGYGENRGTTMLSRTIKATVENFLSKEFTAEIAKAKEELRKQLDAVITKTFVDTLKSAMGLAR